MAGSESAANFRSSYYDKAGIRNANETKALDNAIGRNPVDIGKICCLMQRVPVPTSHRERLWKLVLGVTPADSAIASSIEEDRRGQFEDLKSCLEAMRIIDSKSSQAEIVTLLILLERGELHMNPKEQLHSIAVKDLQIMNSVMCHVSSKLQDAYWLARNFHNNILELRLEPEEMVNQTRASLEKDDPELVQKILRTSFSRNIPILTWFEVLFASVLPENVLLKVWDKFLGGLVGKLFGKHLINTAKIILIHMRPLIMDCRDGNELHQVIQQPLTDEVASSILLAL